MFIKYYVNIILLSRKPRFKPINNRCAWEMGPEEGGATKQAELNM